MIKVQGGPRLPKVVDTGSKADLRFQMRNREMSLKTHEDKQLAACKTPEEQKALKGQFTEARAHRARLYAALLTSQSDFVPPSQRAKEAGRAVGDNHKAGDVLTAFYGLIGNKAREQANAQGVPVAMEHVEAVRLTKADIQALRKEFGDDAVRAAWPLLKKHIVRGEHLDGGAIKFMMSSAFLDFQAQMISEWGELNERLAKQAAKAQLALEEKSLEAAEDHERRVRRKVTQWDGDVVIDRTVPTDKNHDGKLDTQSPATFAVVGGRLVKVADDDH